MDGRRPTRQTTRDNKVSVGGQPWCLVEQRQGSPLFGNEALADQDNAHRERMLRCQGARVIVLLPRV